ncbi:MAG: hypothetical protein D3924_08865, partial [Candidatus Electrothrix sp. AR4]|nr:hypothetical protein [Candidatus Electrothrix sp. AR4]
SEYAKSQRMLEAAIAECGEMDEAQIRACARRDLAYLLNEQGDSGQALTMLRQKVLPVFQELSHPAEQAETMGQIADILQARGQLEDALRIRETEELPVYERLGDVRSKAVTMGQIADILQARGQLEDALRIRETEQLPMYERLGDAHALLIGRTKLAMLLRQMDTERNKSFAKLKKGMRRLLIFSSRRNDKINYDSRIEELLRLALADAQRLRLPEAEQIQGIMGQFGIRENSR